MLKTFVKLFGLIVFIGAIAAGWLWYDMQRVLDQPLTLKDKDKIQFTVRTGATAAVVAKDLNKAGLLTQPRYFSWLARWQNLQAEIGNTAKPPAIKAGVYEIKAGMTPRQFYQLITSGQVVQHSLTLVEGWNFDQIMAAVTAHPDLRHTLQGLSRGEIGTRIGIEQNKNPEGLLFPDTYNFAAGTSDIEILRLAHARLQQKLNEAWSKRAKDLPYKSAYEALIMASLVEKETAVPTERSKIAGVFTRRLKKGMLLQTDPTVIYAMGSQYNGNIRRQDLAIDSPYNTYRYAGLTPTPIAITGVAALEAAMHPEEADTLYFVARGDGTHYFSRSIQEHNNAVAQYQLHKKPTETK